MRENGGRTPSPGHPTAAPLTAGPPLSAVQCGQMETETGGGWRRRPRRRRPGQVPLV